MRLHDSWSLLVEQEFNNFKKQCITDYEAEVVAEYKRFNVDTEKDYGIDPTTTQKQAHDDKGPFDYDDPHRAYEAFLADELADDINYNANINVPNYFDIDDDDVDGSNASDERRPRAPNQFDYEFGNVFDANWYRKFLHPDVRERTYLESERDRYGQFRSLFRVPLKKVDGLVHLFLDKGWIRYTKHCADDAQLRVKAQLLILATLNVLGHHSPFRTLPSNTELCASDHRLFFHLFIEKMYSIKDEYIVYPRNMEELNSVTERYAGVYFPGCGGSIDVVHLKWSACPSGDLNRCKGKEGYPTLAFEVITGYDRQILGVSAVQFGTRNDKHIVKIDENVTMIRDGWYCTVEWNYLDSHGVTRTAVGIYLICDGGYLRWPTLICPYTGKSVASREGYFSAHLESIRKDVECVFGILKKRWKILEYGIRFRDIKVVEKIFNVCCMLHNDMLSEMKTRETTYRVGRGNPLPGDAIWLAGANDGDRVVHDWSNERVKAAARQWAKRRADLAANHEYCQRHKSRRLS